MGNHLQVVKPFWYVTDHPSQLNLAIHQRPEQETGTASISIKCLLTVEYQFICPTNSAQKTAC